jgi:hypothetical protein
MAFAFNRFLYKLAAFDVNLDLRSLPRRPPRSLKNWFAALLPPAAIMQSWSGRHLSRVVLFTKEI